MTGPGADGILLIHGAHHGAWAWDDLAPLLEPPYLAVSLPGREGTASLHAPLGRLTLEDLITSAAADLGRTGWDRAVIVGHSLGGAVAAGLAARAPHNPRRQAATATHLGATVIEIDSGHDPMLSQPAAVAAVINRAVAPNGVAS